MIVSTLRWLGLVAVWVFVLSLLPNKQTGLGPPPSYNLPYSVWLASFSKSMDRTAREAFLAVVEAEEDFLETCKNTSNPVLNSSARGRSLSAAGSATKLKDRNLIPPLNTPKIGGSAWLQDGALESKVSQYFDQYTLVCITRNRQTFASNGRQYGGVALLFRKTSRHSH